MGHMITYAACFQYEGVNWDYIQLSASQVIYESTKLPKGSLYSVHGLQRGRFCLGDPLEGHREKSFPFRKAGFRVQEGS